MKFIIDDSYTVETDAFSFMLKKREKGKINEKTGKQEVSKGNWYYPTLQMCLQKYVQESVKECNGDIFVVINKLDKIECQISQLNLPTLSQIKSAEISGNA